MFFRPSDGEFFSFKGDPSWVEISSQDVKSLLAEKRKGKKLRYDSGVGKIVAEEQSSPSVKQPALAARYRQRLKQLNTEYEIAINQLTAGYPIGEIQSWDRQEEQARQYDAWLRKGQVGLEPPTPFIDILLYGRQQMGVAETKEQLVGKILRNANLFAPAVATLTAIRHGAEKQIEQALVLGNRQMLEAVVWKFSLTA